MRHGSLFSGIGGFDLAAQWMGWENVFQVEWDGFCQKVLAKNFPNVKRYGDIKEFDGTKYRGLIDIISGGFPCQDISISGINNKRKGLQGERSGLFFEMIRIISEIHPKVLIYENSPYVMGEIIKVIHSKLKKQGYVNWGKIITARHFGFPHKRARYYGVSFSDSNGNGRNAFEYFNTEFEKIYKSEEIFRMRKTNKTEFIRTLSTSLRSKAETDFVRNSDGISDKLDKDRIGALGNAVLPIIPYQIFKAIEQYESM
jgi:DNA (cytosine-5)-methyltransferase 1